jgi:hypothetical protein
MQLKTVSGGGALRQYNMVWQHQSVRCATFAKNFFFEKWEVEDDCCQKI